MTTMYTSARNAAHRYQGLVGKNKQPYFVWLFGEKLSVWVTSPKPNTEANKTLCEE